MRVYGRTAVSEFLGDRIVYRNLAPLDTRLDGLEALRAELDLPEGIIPRKSEPDYARVIVRMLQQAHAVDGADAPLERLVFVGDTRLNDSTAFLNISRAGDLAGVAFIGSETTAPESIEIVEAERWGAALGRTLFLANRWGTLADLDRYCAEQGFSVGAGTAVIIDLDKTTLGARGRNAHVIDQARITAVRHTVAGLLRESFNPVAFRTAYDQLNQPEFHPFTADNQDYLAYICLILGSSMYDLQEIVTAVQSGRLDNFYQFISQMDKSVADLPADLRAIHDEVYANVRAGDPTPFKAFRYNEYRTTVALMGQLPDHATPEEMLEQEIVITQEVRAQALDWRGRGALLFGLSDKPDEASIPAPALAAQGYQPIHQTQTHAVGG
jgi:hypothetical protein